MKRTEEFSDASFPKAGLNLVCPFGDQFVQKSPLDGQYIKSTPVGQNVRGYDPALGRLRGGSRPGLRKYITAQLAGLRWIVQELQLMAGDQVGGGGMQTNSSGRVVTLAAVSQGNVYYANAGDTAWTAATNSSSRSPPLNATGVVRSAVNNQLLYFADGNNFRYFQASTGTVFDWTATAGTLPVDASGNAPRLICTWRGRTVVSGLLLDPQDWFMSAVNNPANWDYSPLSTTPTQAIAGNNAPQGLVGDVITALIPYTDDVLIFGGDHTVWMMNGDPLAGGQIDLISDQIGMAFGVAWIKDPYGNVFFVSNKCGIYSLVPGNPPVRISQPIEPLVQAIDTGANTIRLLWNDRFQGIHVFITPTLQAAPATHLFFETRTGAWWQDKFTNQAHNPLCCVTFDGNTPGDRVPLIGSWDGYVRAVDPTTSTDDGIPIQSQVLLGPFLTPNFDDMLLKSVQAVLAVNSGTVTYAVYVGATAEAALASTPVVTGVWQPGRNFTNFVRRSGHAIYIGISSTNPWAMEGIRALIATEGKVRMRGF